MHPSALFLQSTRVLPAMASTIPSTASHSTWRLHPYFHRSNSGESGGAAGGLGKGTMELKLQNVGEEVPGIGDVCRYVVFRARIEEFFTTRCGRRDALILQPQFPPRLVVILGLDLSRKHFPSPLIDQQAERKKGDLLERLVQQKPISRDASGALSSSPISDEYSGVTDKRDRVADRFVETVVGAVPKQHGQFVVGALIKIMTEFVMDRSEVFFRRLDTHLDAQVLDVIDVPGAGVANDITVARTCTNSERLQNVCGKGSKPIDV